MSVTNVFFFPDRIQVMTDTLVYHAEEASPAYFAGGGKL